MKLEELRSKIDGIDDELARLFKQRMEIVSQIADEKAKTGLPVKSSAREREILYRVTGIAGNELENYTKTLFNTIFDLSRNYQEYRLRGGKSALREQIEKAATETEQSFPFKAVVACQGVEGAYSQLVCDRLFSLPQIMYFSRFEGVFQAVESGMCRYGILPIENSSAGSVTEVYDLMVKYKFYIVRSLKLKIEHMLLAKPGVKLEDITEIVSHEQALDQCSDFLRAHPHIRATVFSNTAAAAQYVAQSERSDIAAISSANCADVYGLSVISDKVQNSDHNYTRFICISKKMEIYPGSNKISFMSSVPHKPGSLYSLLSKFSARGLNLCKIESRPIPGKDFEFVFYFDLEASVESEETLDVLSLLESDPFFVFLGAYTEVF
ncbi:MAG: bifunctional chorismate mutase/prephenate dehydratase [Oscillospiraceae bacterium]|jgi:chorismate mutase/prephenate dehydratase